MNAVRRLMPLLMVLSIQTLAWAQEPSDSTPAANPNVSPAVNPNVSPAANPNVSPAVTQPKVADPNTVKKPRRQVQRTVIQSDDGLDPWIPGSNWWGARGMQRVDSAHSSRANSLVFSLSYEMNYAKNFFAPTDTNFYQAMRLFVLWAPIRGLEIGASEALVTDLYSSFLVHTMQALGDPMLVAKYTYSPIPNLGLGVMGSFLIPSAIRSNSFVPRAFTANPSLLATYEFHNLVEVSANVGYVFNQSAKLNGSPEVEERYAFAVSSYNSVSYGLGVLGVINIADTIGLGPYVEATGMYDIGLSASHSPLRASAGLKGYWWSNHILELSVGGDYRITGAPVANGLYPGAPPWGVYAALSLHLFDHSEPKEIILGPPPCNADSECNDGETCHEHVCVLHTEVVKEVVKEVKQETFTISGKVLDAETGRPAQDSVVIIKGFEKTPLQVDYKTGAFHSFPLPCGPGLIQVQVTAPNYKTEDQTMARGKPNEDVAMAVALKRADKPAVGVIKGSLKDGRTGKPIPGGTVNIVALNQKITADAKGTFTSEVRAGRYDVLISAPKYATQRKKLTIHDGDVIILNVDLTPQKKGR